MIFITVTFLLLVISLHSEGTVMYCSDGDSFKGNGTTYAEKIVNNWNSAGYTTIDLQEIADSFKTENGLDVTFETGRSNHRLVRQSRSKVRHGLVAAAVDAYNNHIGLELSPDDLWLAIIQGIANHLSQSERAEKNRQTFVSHQGKKELQVSGPEHGLMPMGLRDSDHNVDPWEGIIAEFADKIKNNTQTDIADIFSLPFTTTTTLESTVFKASLMEAMQNYFSFEVIFLCGIPEIALLGTADDYRDIQSRVGRLSKLLSDLDWWFAKIRKIVTKFLDAMEGKPDLDWWNGIVTLENQGCYSTLTGWLSDFFPYINGYSREHVTDGLDYNQIPYGLSYTPVTLVDEMYTMKKYSLRLVAGFVGISSSCETKRVRPSIGWMMFYENFTNMGQYGDISNELNVLRSTAPNLPRHYQSEKLSCPSNSTKNMIPSRDDGQKPTKFLKYQLKPKGGKRKKRKHRAKPERMEKRRLQRKCRRLRRNHRSRRSRQRMSRNKLKFLKRCSKFIF